MYRQQVSTRHDSLEDMVITSLKSKGQSPSNSGGGGLGAVVQRKSPSIFWLVVTLVAIGVPSSRWMLLLTCWKVTTDIRGFEDLKVATFVLKITNPSQNIDLAEMMEIEDVCILM
ncbi:hypothetical protein BO86DRAFT_154208 [Aspergillus japonicus CBS 114.51]|uniref:Uncharacterized protein n=1 Tax=Aspergillus japonicus CBS 114.51 TaxID=1448312 RepID=A0A8T8WUD0_ASPJA|nr:hypothetical protein BO86DRAFT_154208 [Aspergillus japonicus CBS 114.51]RAH79411.1 hypothetical protein BO86DRAFT_154208 [Aspergillus japonicus CBS 114.51]